LPAATQSMVVVLELSVLVLVVVFVELVVEFVDVLELVELSVDCNNLLLPDLL
jgi:hypothetical protein